MEAVAVDGTNLRMEDPAILTPAAVELIIARGKG
jgi:hypothetical protein